jgi:hypoxanthine phosphoribosyltransferase
LYPLTPPAQLGTNFSHGGLLGRRILIVDEVDDTRTTLMWVISNEHWARHSIYIHCLASHVSCSMSNVLRLISHVQRPTSHVDQPVSSADLILPRYLIRELKNDIEKQLAEVADEKERERLREETKLGIFVVHNK